MLPAVVMLIGCAVSGVLAYEVNLNVRARHDADVRAASVRTMAVLELRAGRVEQLLRGMRAFVGASPEVGAARYHAFVSNLDLEAGYPGVRALAYAPRVARDAVAGLAARLEADPDRRRLGYPPFSAWPASDAPVLFPAVLVEPHAGNSRVFGYDLWSDPSRRAAGRAAIRSGAPRASAPVELTQDDGAGRTSQLLLVPLYAGGVVPDTPPERFAAHVGFIAAGITLTDLMADARGTGAVDPLGVAVYDAGPAKEAESRPDRRAREVTDPAAAVAAAMLMFRTDGRIGASRFDRMMETQFAGRRWLIGFAGADRPNMAETGVVYGALASGVAISLLLATLLHRLITERGRLRAEVAARSRELIRANGHLRRSVEEARGADRAKSQFLASVSHELRTPLNAILGFSELLMTETFGALGSQRNREYVADIHASGQRLLRQVDQILDLSRIEAGGVEMIEEPVDLADALERCRRLFDQDAAGRSGLPPVDVQIRAEADLPRLRGDAAAVDQILLNLIGNAVKFSVKGGEVVARASLGGDGGLRLEVADRGVGIPPEHLDKVVQPFYQVADQHSRATVGSGLGLAIVDRLVRAHGAQLSIESAPETGTVAAVAFPPSRTLPRCRAPARTPVSKGRRGAA